MKKVGNKVPSFKLYNQNEKSIDVKDYIGKKNIVVYFYPKAMTPGCTVQAKGITASKKKFQKLKTVVFAISPDEVNKLKKFEDKENLELELLSDPGHKIADKFGVWGLKKFMGREYMGINRTTFVIGLDGKIKLVMDKVKTKSHHEEVLDWINENL